MKKIMRIPDTPELTAAYLAGNLNAEGWEIEYRSGHDGRKVNPNWTNQADILVRLTFKSGERTFVIGEYKNNPPKTYNHAFHKLRSPIEVKGYE